MTMNESSNDVKFAGYVDPRRKIGSQSEVPSIERAPGTVSVTGYQSFKISGTNVDPASISRKYRILSRYFAANRRLFGSDASILDIGCSSGLLCFLAKESGFGTVTGLDHDPEYIAVLKSASAESGLSVNTIVGDWKSAPGTYDVVSVLALVHWIFSLTASEGSFESIFRYLAEKTRRFLLVEWVDPTDPAIGSLHHTSANVELHKEPYELERFIAAGERHFGSIDARIDTTPTRCIYVFRKEQRVHGWSSVIRFTETAVVKTFRTDIVEHDPAMIDREKKALSILEGVPGIPATLASTDSEIFMTFSGVPVTRANLPEDAETQGRLLVDNMRKKGVRHNDIHPGNLLVKDARLYLIDFAWASFGSGAADYLPRDIGVAYGVRTPGDPFDDQAMLSRALQIVRSR
jgi:SAM-dependent methyltransferase